ncbi:HipA domain-containing protein [Bifidobacterium sp. ESL0769]|uniref:HipA domain-containing protein n=1 Tax=Bifidobacterium sp. ESL0769 TaxID=2983229 RepID=UPI0023F8394E|nr:HipA domain-containing protein [Bifidobacterium sp. ESL0769]WEV66794.1 HipA domain-containing protein [Bifidobacterium sp. ESL0769]
MERRVLMCRTHPVLEFDYDIDSGQAVGTGVVLDERRLPRELVDHGKIAVYAGRINAWWRSRAIPPTRDRIREVLEVTGASSTVDLLNRSLGLSLSDQFWVKPQDSDASWEDQNFFDNTFDERFGELLLTTYSSSHEFSFDVPDSSTGGDLPKRWIINENGKRILVKGGRTGQEPINEVIATKLCERLGIKAVHYSLGAEQNRFVSLCDEMLKDDEELVSAWQLLGSVKQAHGVSAEQQWLQIAEAFGANADAIRAATDDWLLVDFLMRNTDRHYNNFGVIRNVETFEVRPAPLFDTGASLWAGEIEVDNRDYKTKPFFSSPKRPSARRQLELVSDWNHYDLDRLTDWPEEVTTQLTRTRLLPDAKINDIGKALEGRVSIVSWVKSHH